MGTSALSDMYAQKAQGLQAQGLRAYVSGKARVFMLKLICYTFNTLKSTQNLTSILPSVYIVFLEQSIVHMHHFPRPHLNVNWLTFSCSPGISGMRYTWFMYTSDFL